MEQLLRTSLPAVLVCPSVGGGAVPKVARQRNNTEDEALHIYMFQL